MTYEGDKAAYKHENVLLRAENERLRGLLARIVAKHDYKALDVGIGTALPEGKMWLEARAALSSPQHGASR